LNCQGDLETIQAIEKVIRNWNEVILIKDGSAPDPFAQYRQNSSNYSRVYELYVGCYVFPVRLYFDKRVGSEKGRFSVPDANENILFRAVHGLRDLTDRMVPTNSEWKPLSLKTVVTETIA
jgi:hypothetical protein